MLIFCVVIFDLPVVDVAESLFPDRVDQFVQTAEVVGYGIGNGARRLCDLLCPDPFDAVTREQFPGCPDQQIPRFDSRVCFVFHFIIPVSLGCHK